MSGWSVVLTRPGGEDIAARCCERQGYRVYLPKFWSRKARRAVTLFPRYLFVWIESGWWSLRSTPGVSRVIVNTEGVPATVSEKHVKRLMDMERVLPGAGGVSVVQLPGRDWFKVGQKLKVRDRWHFLADRELVFSGMRGSERVKVLMTWLGCEQSIVLDKNLLIAA